MATGQSKPSNLLTRPAARDLSSYQFCAMKIDANEDIDYCDTSAGGIPIGILQNKPSAAGQEAEVAIIGSTSLAKVDGNAGAITGGTTLLGSSNDYVLHAVSGDDIPYFALALEDSSADGDIIEVLVLGISYISGAGDD